MTEAEIMLLSLLLLAAFGLIVQQSEISELRARVVSLNEQLYETIERTRKKR